MKKLNFTTLTCLFALVIMAINVDTQAQDKPRKSPKATTSQRIGIDTDITIDYSRPGVKGRTVWGEIVPYGMYPGNKYSKNKPFPWRAGANENTTIEFNNDLKIEGQSILAGKYSIHMLASETNFKIMFNKKNAEWGSYSYDASQNAIEIEVTPEKVEHTEWLEFGFDNLSANGATAYLRWEKLKIPFKVELAK